MEYDDGVPPRSMVDQISGSVEGGCIVCALRGASVGAMQITPLPSQVASIVRAT